MTKARRQLGMTVGVAGLLVLAGLALTNPAPAEFEVFAASRLVTLAEDELCRKPALPLLLQLVIQNCPAMVQSQRQALGRLAREHSRRLNLGIASVYSTRFGGQQLLPHWRIPNYAVTTVAAAGHFVVVEASSRP